MLAGSLTATTAGLRVKSALWENVLSQGFRSPLLKAKVFVTMPIVGSRLGPLLVAVSVLPWPSSGQQPVAAGLRLKPGDQIELLVKNEPGLSGRFQVSPAGSSLLPLVGLIAIADRPFEEVETAIRTAFAAELADPELLITPLQQVTVLGEVHAPGMFWLDPTRTINDVLALAGGLAPTASRNRITLIRDATETRIRMGADGSVSAVPIRSGDRVYVARRSWLSENLALFVGAAASVAAAAVTSWIVR
jgi:polysaccharide export outer membrane protein